MVDAHFKTLNPISPAMTSTNIPIAIFLCFLIRWMLIAANATMPQINAVLESVMMIAAIRNIMMAVFRMVFLFMEKNALIESNFCLKNRTMTGKNAMRKYP